MHRITGGDAGMEQSGLVADEVIGGRIETKSLLGDECTVTAGRVEEKSRGKSPDEWWWSLLFLHGISKDSRPIRLLGFIIIEQQQVLLLLFLSIEGVMLFPVAGAFMRNMKQYSATLYP